MSHCFRDSPHSPPGNKTVPYEKRAGKLPIHAVFRLFTSASYHFFYLCGAVPQPRQHCFRVISFRETRVIIAGRALGKMQRIPHLRDADCFGVLCTSCSCPGISIPGIPGTTDGHFHLGPHPPRVKMGVPGDFFQTHHRLHAGVQFPEHLCPLVPGAGAEERRRRRKRLRPWN